MRIRRSALGPTARLSGWLAVAAPEVAAPEVAVPEVVAPEVVAPEVVAPAVAAAEVAGWPVVRISRPKSTALRGLSHPEPRTLQCLEGAWRASDLDVGRASPEQEQQ